MRDIPRSGIRDFFDIVQSDEGRHLAGRRRAGFRHALAHPRGGHLRAGAGQDQLHLEPRPAASCARPSPRTSREKFGVTYDPKNQILIAVGVSEAMDIALRAMINPGDEVIYHEPCYVSYSPSIAMAHGVPVAGLVHGRRTDSP